MKKTVAALLLVLILVSMLSSALAEKYSISFPGKVGLMYEGSSVTISPKLKGIKKTWLSWTSSDTDTAAVSSGKIEAFSAGKTVITAACGNITASVGVIVLPEQVNIEAGETFQLPYAGVESFAVQNGEIASVNDVGLITGNSEGTTYVRVRYKKQNKFIEVNVFGGTAEGEADSKAAFLSCAEDTDQIVLVEYQGGHEAELSLHEKKDGVWKQVYTCSASVGKNGIDKTREGDGKTPTGTFNLTTPFGIKSDPGANMPYTKVTKYHYWCGSSGSDYYNQFIDSRVTGRKCTSSDENLINFGSVYNYCMFIDYNAAGIAGKGSCIFLHCKSGSGGTAGCIAVSESVMKNIIKWAKPGCKIVIM